MRYDTIRFIGLATGAASLAFLVIGLMAASGAWVGDATWLGSLCVLSMILSLLALTVGSTLEEQADEIADLRRRLSDLSTPTEVEPELALN